MAKSQSPISFTIERSKNPKKTKQFHCVVRNEGNHEPTLTGEPCKNHVDVVQMIQEHINAIKEGRYSITAEGLEPAPKKRGRRTKGAFNLGVRRDG